MSVNKPAAKAAPASAPAPEKVQAQAEVAAQGVTIDEKILGTLSDALAYTGVIIDPTIKDKKGNGVEGHEVVGYHFRVLRDLPKIVPAFGLDPNAADVKNSALKLGDANLVTAKKGDTLYLTKVETGALLLRPEFNTQATGVGEDGVGVKVTVFVSNQSAKSVTTGANVLPKFSLRASEKGSTTYINPVEAYEATQIVTESGTPRYERKPILKGQLGKFAPLVKSSGGSRKVGSGAKASGPSYDAKNISNLQALGITI